MIGQPVAFDKAEMMENFAGDDELFAEVAVIFIEDVPPQLAALQAALDSGDLAALHAAAHKLKGSLASFAAKPACAAAKTLEDACKVGDAGNAASLAAAVRTETERFVVALRAELGSR